MAETATVPKFAVIGRVMREARKRRGFTQEQMAERLHRTQAQISKWESGLAVPATEDVRLVAREYRLEPLQLLPRLRSEAA